MEFKFRSFNERSSTYSYFTQEAMRAGFSSREFPRNPNGAVRDAMQRELDKERIRAEIIAEEIVRRRVLEEEVRREMMIEREMALRFEPRLPLLTYAEGWDRFGVGVSPHREVGFETPSFQRNSRAAGTENGNSSGITLQEIKEIKGHVLDVKNDKFIILEKELHTYLMEAGKEILVPLSVEELLLLLDRIRLHLSRVPQSSSKSTKTVILPLMNAMVSPKLLDRCFVCLHESSNSYHRSR